MIVCGSQQYSENKAKHLRNSFWMIMEVCCQTWNQHSLQNLACILFAQEAMVISVIASLAWNLALGGGGGEDIKGYLVNSLSLSATFYFWHTHKLCSGTQKYHSWNPKGGVYELFPTVNALKTIKLSCIYYVHSQQGSLYIFL